MIAKFLTTLFVMLAIAPAAFAGCKSGKCKKRTITKSLELKCTQCTKCKDVCSR